MTHSNIPAAAVEAAMEAFAEVIERGPGLQYPIRAALAAALPLIPIAGGEPISDPKIWGGRPTPAEAISLLRAHARKANLPPGDNNFDDAANVIERLSVAPAVGQEPVAIKGTEFAPHEKIALVALAYRVLTEDSAFTSDDARVVLNILGRPEPPLLAAPDYRVDAVVEAALAPTSRLTMWAEVVETYEGDGVEWLCSEESGRDSDTRQILELKADTFPLGTKLEISEPDAAALAALHPAKEG